MGLQGAGRWLGRLAQGALSRAARAEQRSAPIDAAAAATSLREDLLASYGERVAHLEGRIAHLLEEQRRIVHSQTLLQMGETFNRLHSRLSSLIGERNFVKNRDALAIARKYGLSPEDLVATVNMLKKRNRIAHPATPPDLTDADEETMRIYTRVVALLDAIDATRGGGGKR